MAKYELHDRAIDMRLAGASYSHIQAELRVSKSTLSLWLRDYPLSRERINQLRGWSERRIEKCRETKALKKERRLQETYRNVSKEIGNITAREFYIAGLMLYWAEGTKASPGTICMTNTDPGMMRLFISWLEKQGIKRSRLRGYLHLYADMDVRAETRFWAQTLGMPCSAFRKPYIKSVYKEKRRNYKGRFSHGTCNIMFNSIMFYERLMKSIEYINDKARNGFSSAVNV